MSNRVRAERTASDATRQADRAGGRGDRVVTARMLRLALALVVAGLGLPAAASAATGPCLPDGPTCHFWTGKVTFIADGDTIDVRVAGRVRTIRITGINAMELRRYSRYADRRRGDCNGVAATNR